MRLRISLFSLVAMATVSLWTLAQSTGFFQNYPGGYSKSVFRIAQEGLQNPIILSMEVRTVDNDKLSVKSTNELLGSRKDLESKIFDGIARTQLEVNSEAINALRNQAILPNQTYLLPGGAKFISENRDTIAGIEVIRGILTDPKKQNRRTILALTTDKSIPFPPLLQVDELRLLLYVTTYKLELIEYSRQ
jgi:hypothetical protein